MIVELRIVVFEAVPDNIPTVQLETVMLKIVTLDAAIRMPGTVRELECESYSRDMRRCN